MRSLKTHSRKTALALVLLTAWSMYASGAEWQEGSTYTAGTTVTYQGRTYQALRTHTAYPGAGWTPSTTPTLWRDMRPATPAHRHRHRHRAGPGLCGEREEGLKSTRRAVPVASRLSLLHSVASRRSMMESRPETARSSACPRGCTSRPPPSCSRS
ncbi:carbohydrate-binding protein [Paraburkholderia phosphatilytica]|uniref:carbohydrate-binding protein n=1 Tax=Paraburkholderia phosphatilytica TaxID=2282883 RepID=UPI0030B832A4